MNADVIKMEIPIKCEIDLLVDSPSALKSFIDPSKYAK
jgi:hypothetical protein